MLNQHKSWKPGDVIRCAANAGGFRVWRVTGVYLGGEKQEGVVELETLDWKANTQGRVLVPVDLLDAAIGAIAD